MGNVNRQHHVAEFPAKLLRAGTNEITIAVQSTTVLVALEPTVVEALSVIKHSLSANEQQFKNNKALLVDRPLDSRPFTK